MFEKRKVSKKYDALFSSEDMSLCLSPAGRYVLMVSLYDRLGGHVLKWSNLKGQQWGGATLPLQHDGEFFNIEIKVVKVLLVISHSLQLLRFGPLFSLFLGILMFFV